MQGRARDAVSNMDTGMGRMAQGLKLAGEAATDHGGMRAIRGRMLKLPQEIARGAFSCGSRVRGVAGVTASLRSALDELNHPVVQARQPAQRLHVLAVQFQVTQTG